MYEPKNQKRFLLSLLKTRSTLLILPILCVLIVASVFLINTQSVKAEFVSIPDSGTLITDGAVNAIIATSSRIYLGGAFTYLGSYTGSGVPVSTSTGLPLSTYPQVNGTVNAAISDGSNGFYIGGTFTQVGTYTRNRLAHILSNGTVDPNFNPSPDNTVNTLALSTSTGYLYVGGTFANIGGQAFANLAAISTSTGLANTSFHPSPNGAVNAMAISSTSASIYVGGAFNHISSTAINYLALINTSNGSANVTFSPSAGNAISSMVLSSDNKTLYIAFNSSSGSCGGAGVSMKAYNALSGLASSSFPYFSSFYTVISDKPCLSTLALSPNGQVLYVGGKFQSQTIANQTRSGIVAINTSNYSLVGTSTTPTASSTINSLAVSADGSTLYAGGAFATVNGGVARERLAAFNTSDGSVQSFSLPVGGAVNALTQSSDGSTLYIGGSFPDFRNATPKL